MSVHEAGPVCPGCEAKLRSVHPYLVDWFHQHVKPEWPTIHISWGYRGKFDQDLCFRQKTTKLPWPKSAHNRRVAIDSAKPFDASNETDPNSRPESIAIDLFQLDETGKAIWVPHTFFKLSQQINDAAEPIKWGGLFRFLGDADHFEINLSLLNHS